MGIVQLLTFATFYLLCMGIDVVLFFLVVRVFVRRWRTWWLLGLDAAGQKLIDELLARVGGLWRRVLHTDLSDSGQLAAAIALFLTAWLAVHSDASVVW